MSTLSFVPSVSENRICRKFISVHKTVRKQGVPLLSQPPNAHRRQRFALLDLDIDIPLLDIVTVCNADRILMQDAA